MKQILIVDNDPDILDALQFVMKDAGYKNFTKIVGKLVN